LRPEAVAARQTDRNPGLLFFAVGLPAVALVLHLWMASLLAGLVLISFVTLRYAAEG